MPLNPNDKFAITNFTETHKGQLPGILQDSFANFVGSTVNESVVQSQYKPFDWENAFTTPGHFETTFGADTSPVLRPIMLYAEVETVAEWDYPDLNSEELSNLKLAALVKGMGELFYKYPNSMGGQKTKDQTEDELGASLDAIGLIAPEDYYEKVAETIAPILGSPSNRCNEIIELAANTRYLLTGRAAAIIYLDRTTNMDPRQQEVGARIAFDALHRVLPIIKSSGIPSRSSYLRSVIQYSSGAMQEAVAQLLSDNPDAYARLQEYLTQAV